MNVHAIDALVGLRAALEAPEADRTRLFRERVMEPLRPFWEPFMGWMPPQAVARDEGDPVMKAARTFGYFTPDLGAEQGLEAVERLERAGSWPACVEAVQRAWNLLEPPAHGIQLDRVLFTLVLANPAAMNEEAGSYSGFGGVPGIVLVIAWPTGFNVPRLPAAAAHELHHNVRFSYEPFSMHVTLGQYMVAEGLAEAFAAQVCGEENLGPIVNALSDEQMAAMKPRFQEAVHLTGFDQVRGYIFGDWAAEKWGYPPQGVPSFAGYTMGYKVVRAFLDRTGKSAAQASYLPWQEIVEESRFFTA